MRRLSPGTPLYLRIQRWTKRNQLTGCWEWTGHKRPDGYGSIKVDGKEVVSHRAAYLAFRGPLPPPPLVIDHLCRNRGCCNPDHLEIVTFRENILRGISPVAIQARRNECVHGHAYTPDNLYVDPTGKRCCRTCGRDAVHRYKVRKTANEIADAMLAERAK